MAGGAIRWELRSSVIRVRRTGVVRRVATIAGIRRGAVITIVASRAVIRNGRVCSVQRIIIVVDRERSRFPARRGRVAHRAIRREVQRYVVRVCRLVKIRGMTC